MTSKKERVAVVGLGYVGLPLLLAFARRHNAMGIDANPRRVRELQAGKDRNGEVAPALLRGSLPPLAGNMRAAAGCSAFVVAAPTPVDESRRPNLRHLTNAAKQVGGVIKKGDLVVFESTVCPGTTEETCLPLLEAASGLRVDKDFDLGYSPERVSPGDKGLGDAVKVVAATSARALRRVAALYAPVAPAGLHRAPNIRVAEAAKIAENIQRDVDIAATNELAMLFGRLGINSADVFDAAATKWNYRRFLPGLVGGHCIGTDTYYLLERAEREQMPADVIRAARRANNSVPAFVAQNAARLLRERGINPRAARATVFGFSFKENCADARGTLARELLQELRAWGIKTRACDPVADAEFALAEYNEPLQKSVAKALQEEADLLVFAVAHRQFARIAAKQLRGRLVMDLKGVAARADWRL